MASIVDRQLQSLLDGFDALRQEYQRICTRCATLEVNIDTAKSQYARLADLSSSPVEPLNLSTSVALNPATDFESLINSSKIVDANHRDKITAASRTTTQLRSTGVAIHSGPSADKPSAPTSSAMPSISESPLEQDFTVPGTPSRLDCPFASMEKRRLSAHAASVVSRYKPDAVRHSRSSNPRLNGRASSSARNSIVDPIKAEVCAMDSPTKTREVEASVQGSAAGGVCPIRFLDQHSPEEVAAYFESHKHELPRSHEICVKRYQSNEEQIRQLDAKYGNIVSMIQGLGHKHVSLLPEKLADEDPEAEQDPDDERASHEKIRQWASTVDTGPDAPAEEEEERLPHFDRPLKDVRLGESPSRPWGIQVPIDAGERRKSETPSVAGIATPAEVQPEDGVKPERPRGRCPFHFDKQKPPSQEVKIPPANQDDGDKGATQKVETTPIPAQQSKAEAPVEEKVEAQPVFIKAESSEQKGQAQMVFTGPVFIGYSVQEAVSVLQSMQRK